MTWRERGRREKWCKGQGRENEQGEIERGSNGSEDDSDSDAKTQNASSGIPVFAENVGVARYDREAAQWIIIDSSSLMVFFATFWRRRTVMVSSMCNLIKSTWIAIQEQDHTTFSNDSSQ